VHENIHRHKHHSAGQLFSVHPPTVHANCGVVIPVKKYQPLLPQNYEHRVNKLNNFADDEQRAPEPDDGSPGLKARGADDPPDPVGVVQVGEDGDQPDAPEDAEHRQDQAPDHHRFPQLELCFALHVLLSHKHGQHIRQGRVQAPVEVVLEPRRQVGTVDRALEVVLPLVGNTGIWKFKML